MKGATKDRASRWAAFAVCWLIASAVASGIVSTFDPPGEVALLIFATTYLTTVFCMSLWGVRMLDRDARRNRAG